MKKSKEELCKQNLENSKANKTPDWTHKDVNNVLKNLKAGVSRDPAGLANAHKGI